jgi:hypothetical protein
VENTSTLQRGVHQCNIGRRLNLLQARIVHHQKSTAGM